MAQPTTIVTGNEEIDRRLRRFALQDGKGARKAIRRALRNSAKKVNESYRQLVPVESGSMRDASRVMAGRRSRRGPSSRVVIDRERLFRLYRSRTGKEPSSRRGDAEPFFYPATIEFEENRPLRRGLYGKQTDTRLEFQRQLRNEIIQAGR